MRDQSVASCTPPTGDPARNPGMCPEWESNLRFSGLQTGAQSTQPHQPGRYVPFLKPVVPLTRWVLRIGGEGSEVALAGGQG